MTLARRGILCYNNVSYQRLPYLYLKLWKVNVCRTTGLVDIRATSKIECALEKIIF